MNSDHTNHNSYGADLDMLRGRLRALLLGYNANLKAMAKLQNDEMIKEWEQDYRARRMSGGLKGASVPVHRREEGIPESIQLQMILEEEKVVEELYGLRLKIQLTHLLLIGLEPEERQLIEAYYLERLPAKKVSERLYVSRSTFYRRLDKILDKLTRRLIELTDEYADFQPLNFDDDDGDDED